MCPCALQLFPLLQISIIDLYKPQQAQVLPLCWRQGVFPGRPFPPLFVPLWPVHKASPLHSGLTQALVNVTFSELAGSGKPTAWPQGFLDITALVPPCWWHAQLIRGSVSAPAAPTGSSLTWISWTSQIPSIQVCTAYHRNVPTTAKTLQTGTDGLSKQLLSPAAFWVAGSPGPAVCEWPFFQEAPSWEDSFWKNLLKDRFSWQAATGWANASIWQKSAKRGSWEWR